MKYTCLITLLTASTLLFSCNEKEVEQSDPPGASSPLDSFYVAEAPSEARQISEVFAEPTPGREVILSGEIMGTMNPFVDGRGMVVLGDPTKITPCNRIPGDECPTPWDNCCDDTEVLKKSIATIQFLGDDGKVLRAGLRGYKGIEELSFLTVKGKIEEGSNPDNLLVTATAFHVTDPSPYLNAKPVGDLDLSGGTVTEEDGVFIYTKDRNIE